jgi:uncharacterized membrane protein YdjX (TVP38/TMEM64 family)
VSLERTPPAPVSEPQRPPWGPNAAARWALVTIVLAALLWWVIHAVVTDAPWIHFLIRLYRDKHFLKDTVVSWGWLAPVVFIVIQALQVVVSPIPGEITGPVGGALFGTAWGLVYSTIGLTLGTAACFALGRKWGEPLVRPWLSDHHWNRLHFIIEAEGAIICFILYLIPGFPKDIMSYLFGISPMPFRLFITVSTLGRLPGTWISSYFGANVAEHQFISVLLFAALAVAICLPLYYYRDRILGWLLRRKRRDDKGLDGRARRPVE